MSDAIDWGRLVQLMLQGPGAEDRIDGVVQAFIEDDGGTEFRYRVQRRGDLYRCSSLDGRVHAIGGPHDRRTAPPDDYEFGTSRPEPDRFDGDDFTTPTGPARPVTFLGRDALEIELAPPPHKPYPMQLTIDAGSGLVLRDANAAFGTYHEWIELDTDADLPDELFAWHPSDRVAERYG